MRFGDNAAPGLVKECRHSREIGADRPEFFRAVKAIVPRTALDAVAVDFLARVLLSPGEAAVDDGLVERLQAIERIGPVGRFLAQMIKQPRVGGRNASGCVSRSCLAKYSRISGWASMASGVTVSSSTSLNRLRAMLTSISESGIRGPKSRAICRADRFKIRRKKERSPIRRELAGNRGTLADRRGR